MDAPLLKYWDETKQEWVAPLGSVQTPLIRSHVGQIIQSTTLSTAAEVEAVYEGTWAQLTDVFLFAAGTKPAGSVGGAETHTLTENEMPSHDHTVDPPSTTTNTTGRHGHGTASNLTRYSGGTNEVGLAGGGAKYLSATTFSNAGDHSHTVNIAAFSSASTGGGQAHNNMPPYRVVYMWERTA